MSSWQIVLLEPARTVLAQISQFMVNALLVIIILLIGWLLSKVIRSVVSKTLKTAKINELSNRIELDKLLSKGGITYNLSDLIGGICYWLGLLITFMVAVNSIGLTIAADLLNKVVLYIPNVIAALFILILGMFVSTLLKNIVQTAASNAGLNQGKLLAQVVETVVIAFAIFVGLEQLQIGIRITELTISIILGSLGLGLALAFGLGCKDIAGKFVAELTEKLKKK
ncbi:MAG: mechanosensitive ion channel family protein [Candidatus Omnitrophota bacterium]